MSSYNLVFLPLMLVAGCAESQPFAFGYCPKKLPDGQPAIDVRIANVGSDAPVTDDIKVFGTADQWFGMALIDVLVAGQSATSTVGNFAAWEVTIPHEVLVTLVDADGRARLDVLATDLCGNTSKDDCWSTGEPATASTPTCLVVRVAEAADEAPTDTSG